MKFKDYVIKMDEIVDPAVTMKLNQMKMAINSGKMTGTAAAIEIDNMKKAQATKQIDTELQNQQKQAVTKPMMMKKMKKK